MLINKLKNSISLLIFKKKWRQKNLHNKTRALNKFPMKIVKVGNYTYGPIDLKFWGETNERLEIGNFVSIAEGVKFILGGNHEIETFTTYPFKVMIFGEEEVEAWTKGPIIIKDDVWIGMDSLVLSGVTIGQGAIVGAGSVVTKDIPPYAIVGGNPAKIIKHRYSNEIVKEMIKIDWNTIDVSNLKDIREELYKNLDLKTLDKIKAKLFINKK